MWPNPQFAEEILDEKLLFLCSELAERRAKKVPAPITWKEFYIPYKPVTKLSIKTTKLLIVCDASAKSSKQMSGSWNLANYCQIFSGIYLQEVD